MADKPVSKTYLLQAFYDTALKKKLIFLKRSHCLCHSISESLADLVEQHARTSISLPCKLVLPHIPSQSQSQNNPNTNNKQQQYNQSQQSMESLNFNSSTIGRSGSNNNNNRQHMGGFSMGPKSPNHVAVTIPTVQLPFDDDMKDGSIISSVSRRMKSPNRGDPMALHQLSANFKPDRANSNTSLNSQHTTSSVNTSVTNTNASFNGSAQISAGKFQNLFFSQQFLVYVPNCFLKKVVATQNQSSTEKIHPNESSYMNITDFSAF